MVQNYDSADSLDQVKQIVRCYRGVAEKFNHYDRQETDQRVQDRLTQAVEKTNKVETLYLLFFYQQR